MTNNMAASGVDVDMWKLKMKKWSSRYSSALSLIEEYRSKNVHCKRRQLYELLLPQIERKMTILYRQRYPCK